MRKDITAVILAAGAGKRIRPLITSKPLLSFAGKTLLEWVAADLRPLGLKHLTIVVNPKDKTQTQQLFPQAQIVVQPKPTGMGGAILAAEKVLAGPTVVVNGDDILDPKIFKAFQQGIKAHANKIVLTGKKTTQYFPGGYFVLKHNQAAGIKEKPGADKMPSPYLKLVLDYFPKIEVFIKQIRQTKSNNDDLYEAGLADFLKQNPAVLVKTNGYFAPLKYPWHVLGVVDTILTHRLKPSISKQAKIHHSAIVDDSVQIEPGVQIMANAVIKGPAYLGRNVIVGNNVLIRNSIIEESCTVGYNTEIARSYVGPKAWFHCNYVGDSVIEGETNMGSGSRLANLRFDEKTIDMKIGQQRLATNKTKLGAILAKGVKLGINTSIMPGITIGANSLIGAGLVLNKPVTADSKVF